MAHFVWVIRAYSPRDGGWVLFLGHFPREEDAWNAVTLFWDLMVEASDYVTVDVVKTIAFCCPGGGAPLP